MAALFDVGVPAISKHWRIPSIQVNFQKNQLFPFWKQLAKRMDIILEAGDNAVIDWYK